MTNLPTYIKETEKLLDELRAKLFLEGISIPRSKKLYDFITTRIQQAVELALQETALERIDVKDSEYKEDPKVKEQLTRSEKAHFRNGFYQAVKDQKTKQERFIN